MSKRYTNAGLIWGKNGKVTDVIIQNQLNIMEIDRNGESYGLVSSQTYLASMFEIIVRYENDLLFFAPGKYTYSLDDATKAATARYEKAKLAVEVLKQNSWRIKETDFLARIDHKITDNYRLTVNEVVHLKSLYETNKDKQHCSTHIAKIKNVLLQYDGERTKEQKVINELRLLLDVAEEAINRSHLETILKNRITEYEMKYNEKFVFGKCA